MKLKINYPKPPCKIGDMLFPYQMGLRWWNERCWGVITKINKEDKSWKEIKWFKCIDCARLKSELLKQDKGVKNGD